MEKEVILSKVLRKIKYKLVNNVIDMEVLQEIIFNLFEEEIVSEDILDYICKELKKLGIIITENNRYELDLNGYNGFVEDSVKQYLKEIGKYPLLTVKQEQELAKKMNLSEEKVREVMKISQEPVSLETPIGEEEDSHLGDFIPDDDAPAPAEAAAFTMLKEQLINVLDTLTPREEKVLRLRFGLDDGRARTLEEVGKEFNVTRERIRQIEAKALRKLRHPSRSKKLKDYLD